MSFKESPPAATPTAEGETRGEEGVGREERKHMSAWRWRQISWPGRWGTGGRGREGARRRKTRGDNTMRLPVHTTSLYWQGWIKVAFASTVCPWPAGGWQLRSRVAPGGGWRRYTRRHKKETQGFIYLLWLQVRLEQKAFMQHCNCFDFLNPLKISHIGKTRCGLVTFLSLFSSKWFQRSNQNLDSFVLCFYKVNSTVRN